MSDMDKYEEIHRYYVRFRSKVTVIIFFVALVPLVLLGGTIYYHYSTTVKDKIRNELTSIAENRKNTLDLFLNDRTNCLRLLAYGHSYEHLQDRENLNNTFQLLKMVDTAFQDLGVIDDQGNQIAYTGPYPLEGKQYASAEWFQSVMSKDVYVSDVFLGFRDVPHFIIAVKRVQNGKAWILRTTIDINMINRFMRIAILGKSGGDAYILNREGVYQICGVEQDRILTQSDFRIPSVFDGIRETEREIGGRPLLWAKAWLKNNSWLMVIEQDLKDELGPMIHVQNTVLLIFIISILLIIISTVFITTHVFRGLERIAREKSDLHERLIRSDRLAAIGKLASGIAHEINNPLAVIAEKAGWMGDLLTEEDVKASANYDELYKSTEDIKKQIFRGKRVISRLMGFARNVDVLHEEMNINSVLDETCGFLEKGAGFRNIVINKKFQTGLPAIVSDAGQLQQVFINIVNNAIDAIDKNGEITLTTEPQNGGVGVLISDTGPGMPDEIRKRIFDPFFTTKPVGKGTGLGLANSYGIIKQLGGKITVKSKVGVGTTFHIVLPPSSSDTETEDMTVS
jgi:two-component system NtrC family sensor kinase